MGTVYIFRTPALPPHPPEAKNIYCPHFLSGAPFCERAVSNCDAFFGGGRYREATCQWTAEPGVALCLFVIDYADRPGAPNRQLVRRVGQTWVAVWR